VPAVVTVAVPPTWKPCGRVAAEPPPFTNASASSASLLSANILASSCWSPRQSPPISTESGTKALAFSALMTGCVSVGVSSLTSVSSGSHDATTPAELTPRHSLVVIDTTRASDRIGLS
jgi:hypothetical protein